MAMLPCDWCQKVGHPWFECPDPKRPVGWKPDRLKRIGAGSAVTQVGMSSSTLERSPTESAAVRKDVQSGQASHVASRGSDRLIGTPAAGTQALPADVELKRKQAPKGSFDRATYHRDYMVEWRRRRKAKLNG